MSIMQELNKFADRLERPKSIIGAEDRQAMKDAAECMRVAAFALSTMIGVASKAASIPAQDECKHLPNCSFAGEEREPRAAAGSLD